MRKILVAFIDHCLLVGRMGIVCAVALGPLSQFPWQAEWLALQFKVPFEMTVLRPLSAQS